MAAHVGSDAPAQHVPAWKRLGLKLKYAKDTSGQPSPRDSPSIVKEPLRPQPNKRQRDESNQVHHHERPHKRGRDQPEISNTGSKAVSQPLITGGGFGSSSVAQVQRAIASAAAPSHTRFDDDEIHEVQEETAPATARSARSKSVSFTPDTKNGDGFSAQKLFKAWASGEQDQGTNDDTTPPSVEPPSPSTRQARKDKKAKSPTSKTVAKSKAQAASNSEANGAPPEYLEYVRQFYREKSKWKFNKSKQNALLKNLFDIYRIPAEYDDAIIAYVGGLQGANAVQRVLEGAEGVLKELLNRQGRESDLDGMESREARRIAYAAALQREIVKLKKGPGEDDDGQPLEEMQREVARSRRAQAIFAGLLPSHVVEARGSDAARPAVEHESSGAVKQQDSAGSVGANRRKRRKARTEVSSDESSSDSSSSEDSSSEPEDE